MEGCLLPVRVTPRSSRTKLTREGESLHAWVTAAPADGQANAAVCELVAEALGIAKSRVSLARGATSRSKTLRVEGLSLEEVLDRLDSPR